MAEVLGVVARAHEEVGARVRDGDDLLRVAVHEVLHGRGHPPRLGAEGTAELGDHVVAQRLVEQLRGLLAQRVLVLVERGGHLDGVVVRGEPAADVEGRDALRADARVDAIGELGHGRHALCELLDGHALAARVDVEAAQRRVADEGFDDLFLILDSELRVELADREPSDAPRAHQGIDAQPYPRQGVHLDGLVGFQNPGELLHRVAVQQQPPLESIAYFGHRFRGGIEHDVVSWATGGFGHFDLQERCRLEPHVVLHHFAEEEVEGCRFYGESV
mmetsp:Transcript_33316/g.64912  ORF Transcript_33316/g.64912 Transcript_33316/m.64912 type:complete len:275 (+) Transcript_33316:385-1209(+)